MKSYVLTLESKFRLKRTGLFLGFIRLLLYTAYKSTFLYRLRTLIINVTLYITMRQKKYKPRRARQTALATVNYMCHVHNVHHVSGLGRTDVQVNANVVQ